MNTEEINLEQTIAKINAEHDAKIAEINQDYTQKVSSIEDKTAGNIGKINATFDERKRAAEKAYEEKMKEILKLYPPEEPKK